MPSRELPPPSPAPQPPEHTNRLAHESSPYLLQHAHNPVDWYPWGPEAFAEARRRDVPIFLSVGYSTCYWCHVMERESFESETIARRMNETAVCIKVDREERPDVDDVYMAAVQAMTGGGGWPMNLFLEPKALKPFWGGTYFPPEEGYGRPGFGQILGAIGKAWREQRAGVLKQADELAEAVKERLAARHEPMRLGTRQVSEAVGMLLRIHDRVHGGFGSAPKFPQPAYLDLLLEFRPSAGDEDTLNAVDAAVRTTLDKMALGGVYDQVGGGFHRYSTDERWLVPHFEKMLYDNGQLAQTYARAARVYGDGFYGRVVRRTLDFVLREMTSPAGAFFSAQDAEVNHREGQNYLWTAAQFDAALGADDAKFAAQVYGLAEGTNFQDPHHPDEPPANVLFMAERPAGAAARLKMPEEEFLARLDRVNAALYEARARRDQPRTDDKVLTGWNGLMIAGLAVGGAVLEDERYIEAAERAAGFVWGNMRQAETEGGGLLRAYRACGEAKEGAARIPAFLEDYAFFIHGLIELHRAGRDGKGTWLARAVELTDQAQKRFGDEATGGYFDTLADQEDLFIRVRSEYDGAVPCGSSVMLNNLLDLYLIAGDRRHLERAGRCLASLSAFLASTPVGAANSTRGLLRLLTIEPAALERAGIAAGHDAANEPGAPAVKAEQPSPVQVFAGVDRVEVGPDEPAGLALQIRIADGYHINAADVGPGGKDLVGLRVFIVNGTGVAAYADYPKGEPYGKDGEICVHKGTISVPVVLERHGEWGGRPLLAVTYQACTERACLAAMTVELDVAIDRK